MSLSEMIYKRKSVRRYTDEPVSGDVIEKINGFIAAAKPLCPEIRCRAEVVAREDMHCVMPLAWIPPQSIVIYSDEKEGWLENIGFIFQQLDLYMQDIGLGTCWLGLGRPDKGVARGYDDLKFAMMIAFGYPAEPLRNDISQFKRKTLAEIADVEDKRLECARIAPSSVNSQPWYFTHDGEVIHAYRALGLFRALSLGEMNRIDMGIALAHLYVSNSETFRIVKAEAPTLKGYAHTASFVI